MKSFSLIFCLNFIFPGIILEIAVSSAHRMKVEDKEIGT